MFKSMRLKNFKAYKDSGEVPLAPLTVFVGANNSGKSTLFHALLGLVQTVRDPNQGWGLYFVTNGLIDLSGYQDIVHSNGVAETSSFEISVCLDGSAARPRTLTGGSFGSGVETAVPDTAAISFGLDDSLGQIIARHSTLRFGGKAYISAERPASNTRWSLTQVPEGTPQNAGVEFRGVFPCFSLPMSGVPSPEYLAAILAANFRASVWMDAFAHYIGHVGPLRIRVPWRASIGARTGSENGVGGDSLLADLMTNHPQTGQPLIEAINDWVAKRKILQRLRLDTKKDGRSLRADEFNGPKNINVAGMGEGVSQMLPIIAHSLFGRTRSCLLVEQPEIHLHPALQAELGDLFIEATQAAGDRQILVETHSEHLLLRIRRRIAEGTLKPEQVAILFVEKEHGESKVRRLDLNSRGHFSDWPKGFFDEAYQEAMALAEAAAKKGR